MTKEELALSIAKAMYKDRLSSGSFNAYQSINKYFLELEIADLIGIAGQYGISVH